VCPCPLLLARHLPRDPLEIFGNTLPPSSTAERALLAKPASPCGIIDEKMLVRWLMEVARWQPKAAAIVTRRIMKARVPSECNKQQDVGD
jgi:hypothetical protein